MKAITLHQPWASLIACGLKTIETRDWPPPREIVGDRIAIHAGKRDPDSWEWNDDIRLACEHWDFDIPLGVVVATARLAEVRKVTQNPRLRGWEPDYDYVLATNRLSTPDHREVRVDPFGDFSEGRWLWFLEDIRPLDPPVPARGRQRLWEWDVPWPGALTEEVEG